MTLGMSREEISLRNRDAVCALVGEIATMAGASDPAPLVDRVFAEFARELVSADSARQLAHRTRELASEQRSGSGVVAP